MQKILGCRTLDGKVNWNICSCVHRIVIHAADKLDSYQTRQYWNFIKLIVLQDYHPIAMFPLIIDPRPCYYLLVNSTSKLKI